MNISDQLIKFNSTESPENFVAIACKIVDKKATHAAILIRHKTINHLHHFPGSTKPEVLINFNEDNWYIYKILEAINVDDESEVGSFLQYCKRVCAKSNITYSFIADGSKYAGAKGDFVSKIGLPELGTCVGFCVNTLSNTLIDAEESYFKLEDWDDSDLIEWVDEWAIEQVAKKYPDLDWNLYNAFKKRITPLEYLASSFINKYPIKKSEILTKLTSVQDAINAMF